VLCLKLFEKCIRFLRINKVDETGLERIKVTLEILESDFKSFLNTAEELMVQHGLMKEVENAVNFCRERNAEAQRNASFIIEILKASDEELKEKVDQALYIYDLQTIKDYLKI